MATDLSALENFFDEEIKASSEVIPRHSKQVVLPESNSSFLIPIVVNDSDLALIIRNVYELARKLDITTDPLDIKSVVERVFNMEVTEIDLGRTASGFLERIGDKWHIYVNKFENEVRKRFTIAHELGHFVRHRSCYATAGVSALDQIFFRDENTNQTEREANDFAASLLMPAEVFKNSIRDGANTIEKLADKFNLSTSAVRYRAYKLGIISKYN